MEGTGNYPVNAVDPVDPNGDLELLRTAVGILAEIPLGSRAMAVTLMRLTEEHMRSYGGIAPYSLDYLQARASSEDRKRPVTAESG